MIFKSFGLKVGLRVAAMVGVMLLFFVLAQRYNLPFTFVLLLLVLVAQVAELLYFIKRTNQELARFLETIRHHDFSTQLNFPQKDWGFKNLENEFQALFEVLRGSRKQQENHSQLVNLILQKINLGLIVLSENEQIELINEQAQRILQVPEFTLWARLQEKRPELTAVLANFNFTGRKLLRLQQGSTKREYYLDLEHISLDDKTFHLITLSDLRNEIEQKEIDAWHKLIRILSHEVMNSVTPVVSLSQTLSEMVTKPNGQAKAPQDLDPEDLEDMRQALATIVRRSHGMLNFVEEYRKLTKLPAPNFETVGLAQVFTDLERLLSAQAAEQGVNLHFNLPQKRLALKADKKMLEQILLNLIKNALMAIADEDCGDTIRVSAQLKENHLLIEVEDNGPGIEKDVLPQIFIPFYSTRKNGTGIGLSLSKNIMSLHNGHIEVSSQAGQGAKFSLYFSV